MFKVTRHLLATALLLGTGGAWAGQAMSSSTPSIKLNH